MNTENPVKGFLKSFLFVLSHKSEQFSRCVFGDILSAANCST
jgi:hypothetical protein